jgi:hypothetical protein
MISGGMRCKSSTPVVTERSVTVLLICYYFVLCLFYWTGCEVMSKWKHVRQFGCSCSVLVIFEHVSNFRSGLLEEDQSTGLDECILVLSGIE